MRSPKPNQRPSRAYLRARRSFAAPRHILAISGLHVGIITAILLLLLQKMPFMLLTNALLKYN
ncbi:MAG: ComEC/Rec2 family competence protein [Prevotella melaninogenica]